ncbi:hypothetical protein BKA57DRAFT_7772 [Linnemannia elongata]|nr:hypothetical protein BKA57DRAFT_7772 [Linnemannia elongata]
MTTSKASTCRASSIVALFLFLEPCSPFASLKEKSNLAPSLLFCARDVACCKSRLTLIQCAVYLPARTFNTYSTDKRKKETTRLAPWICGNERQ